MIQNLAGVKLEARCCHIYALTNTRGFDLSIITSYLKSPYNLYISVPKYFFNTPYA